MRSLDPRSLTRILGVVLVLGGVAHTAGVAHHYVAHGLPDANRLLLDAWIAEAQLAGGILFLLGRDFVLAGACVVWSWALPFLPVLIHRAKPHFIVMPIVYSLASVLVVSFRRKMPA